MTGTLEAVVAAAEVSPHLADVRVTTRRWLARFDDLGVSAASIERWNFSYFASALFARSSCETIGLAAEYTHWLAVVDDLVEHDHDAGLAWCARFFEPSTRHRLVDAWLDLERRLAAGDAAVAARARANVVELFASYRWERDLVQARRPPSFEDYYRWRPINGGVRVFQQLLEQEAGGPFSPAARAALDAFDRSIANLTCWAHDLLSGARDEHDGHPINLLRVVGGPDAAAEARRRFEEEWARSEDLARRALAEVPAAERDRVRAYVERAPGFVGGSGAWIGHTLRYEGARERTAR